MKVFSYKNSSAGYQLHRHRLNRHKIVRAYLYKSALNEVEARQMWQDELERLEKAATVSLLKVTPDNLVIFPTGLLNKVIEFFVKAGMSKEEIERDCVVDLRKRPVATQGYAIQGKPANLRPYQQEAVIKLLAAGQGTYTGGTGTGKTVVIQELIRRLGHKTLVIVPSLSIMRQTVVRFQKYFGRGAVGQFGGGKKLTNKLKNITVACAPSVAKSDPEFWKSVDVLICDESHHTPAATIETIFYKVIPGAFYRFGFTATNFRNDGADLAIEAAVFPSVCEYSVEDGIRDGYLAKPKFIMYKVDKNSYRSYRGDLPVFAFKYHVLRNEILNKKVIAQINAIVGMGKQVLVLVREKEHGYRLFKDIPGAVFVRDSATGEVEKYNCPELDSHEAVSAFNAGKIQCMIGTSIIGEGTDIVPVDVLINLMGGKSKLEVMQNIGRGLRTAEGKNGVLIIDYIHSTNQMLERHSLERFKIYKKIGDVDIQELK